MKNKRTLIFLIVLIAIFFVGYISGDKKHSTSYTDYVFVGENDQWKAEYVITGARHYAEGYLPVNFHYRRE